MLCHSIREEFSNLKEICSLINCFNRTAQLSQHSNAFLLDLSTNCPTFYHDYTSIFLAPLGASETIYRQRSFPDVSTFKSTAQKEYLLFPPSSSCNSSRLPTSLCTTHLHTSWSTLNKKKIASHDGFNCTRYLGRWINEGSGCEWEDFASIFEIMRFRIISEKQSDGRDI